MRGRSVDLWAEEEEEPILSEFHPSQRESSWQWSRYDTSEMTRSVLEPYRALHEIFHSLLVRTILRSWAVEAGSSYLAPASHLFDSAPEECWIFVLVNIPLNFALKYWDGVTKILISSFKRLTGFSLNGTTGASFFSPLFRMSLKGKTSNSSLWALRIFSFLISCRLCFM